MDSDHLHIKPGGRGHGLGDGVGDVMKFQVQEDQRARGPDLFDDVRPGAGEEFVADLESAADRRELVHEFQGGLGGRGIQGDKNWISHGGKF